jgi:hypothetical protein
MAHPRAYLASNPQVGGIVDHLMKTAGAHLTHAARAPREVDRMGKSWALLVRLSEALEELFGISREVLVYSTPFAQLQTQTIDQVLTSIASAPRMIETEIAFVVTHDPDAVSKLRDWSVDEAHGIVLIPLVPAQLEARFKGNSRPDAVLPQLLADWLFSRDLYEERGPAVGGQFFGRRDALHSLTRAVSEGSSVGVFGLRKIGKTSLLRRVVDQVRGENQLVVFYDLQLSSAAESAGHVARALRKNLMAEAGARGPEFAGRVRSMLGSVDDAWRPGTESAEIVRLADGLTDLLDSCPDLRVGVILDEIEVVFGVNREPATAALDFFRALRGVSQQTGRLSLTLAGVNATPSEVSMLSGEDNPLYSFLSRRYLGPLSPDECAEMIQRIGKKMGLRWGPQPTAILTEAVGSHPLLARLAGSDIARVVERPTAVDEGDVHAAIAAFPNEHNDVLLQMVESLETYYPEELTLLRLVAADDEMSEEWAETYPAALNHLREYGILEAEPSRKIRLPVVAEWLGREAGV